MGLYLVFNNKTIETMGRNKLPEGKVKVRLDLWVEGYLIESAGGRDKSKDILERFLRRLHESKAESKSKGLA